MWFCVYGSYELLCDFCIEIWVCVFGCIGDFYIEVGEYGLDVGFGFGGCFVWSEVVVYFDFVGVWDYVVGDVIGDVYGVQVFVVEQFFDYDFFGVVFCEFGEDWCCMVDCVFVDLGVCIVGVYVVGVYDCLQCVVVFVFDFIVGWFVQDCEVGVEEVWLVGCEQVEVVF